MRDFTFRKKWGRRVILLFLSFSVFYSAFAQTRQINGKVVDAKTNEEIIGATIRIKGTDKGAATDANGNFKIMGSDGQVLTVSYLGYQTIDIPVNGSAITIKLTATDKDLNEVVVVGYGTQKKATLTGSIATVGAKAFQDKGVIDNPISAIQGTVPGTVVTRQSAAPGRENWNLQINGQTSTSGSDPLYVIDGVPVSVPQNDGGGTLTSNTNNGNLSATLTAGNALSSLNPDDIESISILKDASAAIYGARAAGGVVLITTKRGKTGKPQVTYDGSLSIKSMGLEPHLATGAEYGEGLMQAVSNDYAGNPPSNNPWYSLGKAYLGPYAGSFIDLMTYNGQPIAPANNPLNPGFGDVKDLPLFNTNALEQIYLNNTLSTSHDLSIAGGSDKDQYRVSFGYLHDGSLLRYGQNSNNRYNLRFTNDAAITSRLKLSTSVSLEENDIILPTAVSIIYQFSQPGLPAFSKNGQPYAMGYAANPSGRVAGWWHQYRENYKDIHECQTYLQYHRSH